MTGEKPMGGAIPDASTEVVVAKQVSAVVAPPQGMSPSPVLGHSASPFGVVLSFMSYHCLGLAVLVLLIAALVFAALPLSRSKPQAILPVSPPAEKNAASERSTFGGAMALPKADVRAVPMPQAMPASRSFPAFAPRSGGLYATPADGR
ncbi:hypothetical protein NAC44_15315 [Allorhizobium sp. BGMRC 0089]|uniref:hypothetical protein n=1 Tax=Allorhizobium sonneratiae TaxID=2934936 RepID=UPI0020334A53|nr:hypothetical protein [Allorhizobium sonneratiae]MCM2293697.1 hypothetical protein [Allorhizobium sonneratiae]